MVDEHTGWNPDVNHHGGVPLVTVTPSDVRFQDFNRFLERND